MCKVCRSGYRYCFSDSTSNDSLCIDLRDPGTALPGRRRPPLAVSSKFNPKTLQFDGRLARSSDSSSFYRPRVPDPALSFSGNDYPQLKLLCLPNEPRNLAILDSLSRDFALLHLLPCRVIEIFRHDVNRFKIFAGSNILPIGTQTAQTIEC